MFFVLKRYFAPEMLRPRSRILQWGVQSQEKCNATSREIKRGCSPCRGNLEGLADSRSSSGFFRRVAAESNLRSDRYTQKHGAPLPEASGTRTLSHPHGGRCIPDRSAPVAIIATRKPGSDA